MTTYKTHYKANNAFGDIKNNRAFNKKIYEIQRKEQRNEIFAKKRELEDIADVTTNTGDKDNRYYKLLRWKTERDTRKKVEQIKKKPPFKVGVVHHKYYSPPVKDSIILSPTKQCLHGQKQITKSVTPAKRITRATQKRLLQKSMASNKVPQIQKVAEEKQEILKEKEAHKNSLKNKKSFAPNNYKFTAPSGLANMTSFGRAAMLRTPVKTLVNKENTAEVSLSKIKSELSYAEDQSNNETDVSTVRNIAEIKTENNTPKNVNSKQPKVTLPVGNVSLLLNSPKDPVFFSPYIVSSRGKSNARKEQQIRRGIGCTPSEDIPTKDTVMKNLNISIEEEERTAQYFSFMLNKEIVRLNDLCKKWTEIQSELDITEDAQYQINQAIGQTNLLINKKFERFRGLVLDCETGKGEMLVTCRDLQGFWDMMYMEVMNCDSRFKKLEELRSNGWKEEEIAISKIVPNKKVKSKKKIVSKSKSSVQDFILAAKKKMKNKTDNIEILKDHMNESINKLSTSINNIDIEQNKNEILRRNDSRHSVSINSKDRLSFSDKKTNSRQSLLQKTLLSESCKTVKTPITIMKISQMYKTPKIELDDTISYINCKQTPSKSILKRTNDSTINGTRYTKSVQKVNFDDNIILQEVPIDKETQNKLDLAARLERIDNYDLDAEYANYDIKAGKKLNFSENSILDSGSDLQWNTEQLNLPDVTKRKDDTLLNSETEFIEHTSKSEDTSLKESPNKFIQNETNIRILRNRVVVTDNSTRALITRRSSKGLVDQDKSNQKENETPVKSERRSSRLFKQKESMTPKNHLNATPVNLKKNLRKSLRKSVKFNAEEYKVCTEYKPTHPMTPHTRRTKENLNLSYLKDISPIELPSVSTDLISWDSPKISTRRSSRSSKKHFL